ncbi:hypothetical protein J8J20_23870, partial [Mycobacterium tuberculosis]|nr:hypothetical protein [Mycobacterium tuberculosis]
MDDATTVVVAQHGLDVARMMAGDPAHVVGRVQARRLLAICRYRRADGRGSRGAPVHRSKTTARGGDI